MPLRRIYDHEFVYVISGEGEIIIEGQAHPAHVDSLFLILPRVWHSFRACSHQSITLLGVHFDWVPQADSLLFPVFRPADEPVEESLFRVPRPLPGWDLHTLPFLDLKGRSPVRHALEAVVMEYSRESATARLAAGALLAATIIQITQESQSLHHLKVMPPLGADAMRRLERARALLETVGEASLSIEAVAAHVGWSADHLRRVFRLALDTSPQKLQRAARLRYAKQLMRHENLPISTIALRCGFEDASHFTRVFKQDNGLTPRQFLALAKKA
ncbi:MAG: AraC family transcriptional regulator [Abitibacteriaceae bacterium]|nr:AraC family transcriptional regulator [Abditibacteriaceae bacterium]